MHIHNKHSIQRINCASIRHTTAKTSSVAPGACEQTRNKGSSAYYRQQTNSMCKSAYKREATLLLTNSQLHNQCTNDYQIFHSEQHSTNLKTSHFTSAQILVHSAQVTPAVNTIWQNSNTYTYYKYELMTTCASYIPQANFCHKY